MCFKTLAQEKIKICLICRLALVLPPIEQLNVAIHLLLNLPVNLLMNLINLSLVHAAVIYSLLKNAQASYLTRWTQSTAL